MQLSKYNIISKIKDSDDWFVVNALSGQADVLDQETYTSLISGEENPEFAENGYLRLHLCRIPSTYPWCASLISAYPWQGLDKSIGSRKYTCICGPVALHTTILPFFFDHRVQDTFVKVVGLLDKPEFTHVYQPVIPAISRRNFY